MAGAVASPGMRFDNAMGEALEKEVPQQERPELNQFFADGLPAGFERLISTL